MKSLINYTFENVKWVNGDTFSPPMSVQQQKPQDKE